MSQPRKSVKVPTELLDTVKVFHKQRAAYAEAMEVLQDVYDKETNRLVSEHKVNCVELAKRLIDAGLLREGDSFTLNTDFVEDHGDAFMTVIGPDLKSEPAGKPTIH